MSDIKILIDTEVELSKVRSEIEKLQKDLKPIKFEIDSKEVSRVGKEVDNLTKKISSTSGKKLQIFDESSLRKNQTDFVKIGKSAEDAMRRVEASYKRMNIGDVSLGWDKNAKELDGFTIKVKEAEGLTTNFRYKLGELENGASAFVNVSTRGMEDYSKLLANVETKTGALMSLQKKLTQLADNSKTLDSQSEGFKRASAETDRLNTKIKDYMSNVDKLDSKSLKGLTNEVNKHVDLTGDLITQQKELISYKSKLLTIEKQISAIESRANGLNGANPERKRILDEASRIRDVQKEYMNDLKATNSVKLGDLSNRVKQLSMDTSDAGASTNYLKDSMKGVFSSAARWVSLTIIVRTFFREMKKGVEVVKEIDSAMMELRKVTNATEAEYANFAKSSFQTGRELGRTGVEVISATADFARMGFELKQATGLAKEALLMLNVGDGIENLDHATKSMIATLKGFGVEGENAVVAARQINDAYNEVANNFAVDTGALAEGVRRISAIMSSAGNDMNETIGLLTGGFEVMQDTRKVSSGLNIITQRLKGIKDEGKETIVLLPTLKKQFKEIAGINLEKQNGGMKTTYQILGEMAKVFPTLRDQQRNYLMELAAGKRQAVVLESILQNWENVEAATLTAANSMGSALVENQVYMDSIEGKMKVLTATTQEFWATAIDTGSVKGFVDSGTQVVRVMTDIVESLGGVETAALVVMPLIGIKMTGAMKKLGQQMLNNGNEAFANSLANIATKMWGSKLAVDATSASMATLSAVTLGVQAALLFIPAAIFAITNAEQKRKRAMEDSMDLYEKQSETYGAVNGLVDIYGDLAQKQKLSANEAKQLAMAEERIRDLAPEIAKEMDNKTRSIDENVAAMKDLTETELEMLKIQAEQDIITYGKNIDAKRDKIKELDETIKNNIKNLEHWRDVEAKNGELTREESYLQDKASRAIDKATKSREKLTNEVNIYDAALEMSSLTMGDAVKGFKELGNEVYDAKGAFVGYKNEIGDIVDEQGEVVKSAQEMATEGLEVAKTALSEATFGTQEYIDATRELINAQNELNGVTKESEVSGKSKYLDDLTAKYEKSEDYINTITQAEKELAEQGEVSWRTQTKLKEHNIDLMHIRGQSQKQVGEILKLERRATDEKIKGYEDEIKAAARNESIYDKQISNMIMRGTAAKDGLLFAMEEATKESVSMVDVWNGLNIETKDFIIEATGLDETSKDFHKLLQEWLKNSPEPKQFIATIEGLEYIEENLGDWEYKWNELEAGEKEFIAKMIIEGEKDPSKFIEVWDKMTPGQKDFVSNFILNDNERAREFISEWDSHSPEVKRFIAEQVGLEGVQEANEETMNSWGTLPEVKMFLADSEGLENVRVEKTETDGVWSVTIGDKTYKTNEEGAALARETIEKLQNVWKNIPNTETKTKTTRYVEETIYKQSGKLPTSFGSGQRLPSISSVMTSRRWTGDDNFKGGLSYVGEKGRELLVYPDGSHDMTGSRAELRNLPRGTKIYNNQDTEAIMSGKKIPEFERSDKRVTGSSNTPGFAKGNTKVKGNPMPPNATSAQARASALAKANAKTAATKSATKAIKEQYKAEVDLYEKVNIEIEKQNNLIKKNVALQEGAKDGTFGKIRLIQEQIKLEKQHQKLLNDKIKVAIRERNQQEALLKKSGFKFKGSGNSKEITNLQNIKGKSEQVEEAFNKFNELQFKTIPGLQVEIMEMANAIQSALSAGFTNQMRLDNRVKENDHLIAINKINQEREKDVNKRVLLMKEEIKLIEHKAYLSRGQVKIYQAEREEIETILRKQGFIFAGRDGGRKITNPQKLKGQVKEIEELFNRYNELQIDVIPNLVIDSEGFKDNVDKIKDSINDALIDSKFEESDKEIEDYNYTIEMSRHNRATNQRKDPYWQVKTRETELEALEGRYNVEYSKGWDYLNEADKYKKDSEQYKKLKAKSDEYFRASRASELEIAQLKEDLHKARLQHIDEEVDTYREKQEELRYQLDLLDEDSLDERARLTSKIVDEEVKVRNAMKNTLESLKEQLEVTLYNTDEWHVINDSVKEYEKKVRESNLELKKMKDNVESIAKEQAKVSFDKTLEGIESSLFNGKTESEAREDFEHKLYLEGKYIEGAEKELEIARLKNYAMREELTLTKEQNSILNGNGKIERASLDKMSKQLDIQRLQNKLANERNQKNIRQLKKNEDGTFGFEFVADAKVIQETEDELAQKKVDLIKWERDYQNDQDRKSLEDKSSYLSKLDDILKKSLDGEYKTASEFYQAMEKLNIDFMSRIDDAGYLDVWEDMVKNMSPLLDNLGLIFRDLLATVNDSFKEQVTSSKEQWDKLKSELSIDTVSTHKINIEAILDVEDSAIEDANSGLSVEKAPDKNLLSKQYEILSQKLKTLVPNIPDFLSGINDINFKKILPVTSNVYVKDNNSNSSGDTGVAKQVFNIDKLEFPNVTNSKEIEESIRNLSTFATQWANKK